MLSYNELFNLNMTLKSELTQELLCDILKYLKMVDYGDLKQEKEFIN